MSIRSKLLLMLILCFYFLIAVGSGASDIGGFGGVTRIGGYNNSTLNNINRAVDTTQKVVDTVETLQSDANILDKASRITGNIQGIKQNVEGTGGGYNSGTGGGVLTGGVAANNNTYNKSCSECDGLKSNFETNRNNAINNYGDSNIPTITAHESTWYSYLNRKGMSEMAQLVQGKPKAQASTDLNRYIVSGKAKSLGEEQNFIASVFYVYVTHVYCIEKYCK